MTETPEDTARRERILEALRRVPVPAGIATRIPYWRLVDAVLDALPAARAEKPAAAGGGDEGRP